MSIDEHVNESLTEIKDPRTRAKLEGIQECVWSMDAQIIQTKKAISDGKAAAFAIREFGKLVYRECDKINAEVKAAQLEPEIAKAMISQIVKVKNMAESRATELQVGAHKAEGEVNGLEKGIKLGSDKFTEHVSKYERWERIKQEEQQNQKTVADVAQSAKSVAKHDKTPKKKSKVKPSGKKAVKRKARK